MAHRASSPVCRLIKLDSVCRRDIIKIHRPRRIVAKLLRRRRASSGVPAAVGNQAKLAHQSMRGEHQSALLGRIGIAVAPRGRFSLSGQWRLGNHASILAASVYVSANRRWKPLLGWPW